MKIIAKKSLGQNFLTDKKIINLIVENGNINNKVSVIEVGPGKGALTEKILEKKPKELIVIEKDDSLVKILDEKFRKKIKIFNEDMMKFSYEKYYRENSIIFGNLPYNISTQILAKWIKLKEFINFVN